MVNRHHTCNSAVVVLPPRGAASTVPRSVRAAWVALLSIMPIFDFRRQLARRGVRVGDAQDLWFARSCPMTYVRSRR
jgi:hypothetical protein